jgi:uncharacterized LabA/DUF88 family protein
MQQFSGEGFFEQNVKRIAVYWDFENIHNGIQPPGYTGPGRPLRSYEEMVNVKLVMEYLNSLGNVVINRAYGNWTLYKHYRFILLEHSVDLIQLFHRGQHAKNGADIRIAIDAIEDIFHYPDVDVQVVVGGDSDFTNLAQQIRKHGNFVIGIGARDSSNIYWIKSCNVFRYYQSLLPSAEGEEDVDGEEGVKPAMVRNKVNIDDAKDLLLSAVKRLARSNEEGHVSLYNIRPVIIRMDPSFDEGDYGHDNFTKFVEACGDVVQIERSEEGIFVKPAETKSDVTYINADPLPTEDLESIYRNTLRQIHYRMIPPADRVKALDALYDILQDSGPIEDQSAVKEMLIDKCTEGGSSMTDEDAQNIWDMGYKANVYYFQEYPFRKIVLNERVQSKSALFRRADLSVVKRILGKCPVQPLKPEPIANLLYGAESDKTEYVAELIGEALTMV